MRVICTEHSDRYSQVQRRGNCSVEAVAAISRKVLERDKGDATELDFQVTFARFPGTRPERPDSPLGGRVIVSGKPTPCKVHLSSILSGRTGARRSALLRCRPLCLGPRSLAERKERRLPFVPNTKRVRGKRDCYREDRTCALSQASARVERHAN